ncbi:hypothetical protein AMATHDRAFT_144388 [Amanita thiersii Skay4041]|uniref:Copper transport protein n=1 Tax=Amanita thiersii Skay4041 TaxID=703135 RepID=A0A2A9NSK0_9AGAR|nr:hypothetical protein AMATHDRAFT_144388 [Amanita thiersii Skay4041]
MMIPYLHFTKGDHLYFKAWHPETAGAIAGASIGLFFLAVVERWLSALRAILELRWNQRALALTTAEKDDTQRPSLESLEKVRQPEDAPQPQKQRTIAPFILSHDVPRGILHGIQALVGYLLMLAIMSFQAAYLISIVVGLGVGEIVFGRIGTGWAGRLSH